MEEDAIDFDPPFVGREAELKRLEAAWKRHAIFGIFGVRAVGKSRFVKQFLKRNGSNYGLKTNVNMIKINLKMFETTIGTLIHLIYSSLGIMPDKDAINNGKWKEHLVSEVVKKLTDLQCLLLWFDNAEDALDLDRQVHDQLLSLCVTLVQHCRGIKIIITSTTKFLFTQIRNAYFQLELNPLTQSEVIQLLKQVSPDVEFGEFAGPIAEQCEGLPLLVTMTASELSEDNGMVNPEEMFDLLLENKLRVLSREYYPEEDRIADVYSKFLLRLPEVLQRRLATLNYIPGSFNAIEASEILGYDKVSTVKDQALIPIRRRYVLNFDSQSGRFNIQGILRNCIDSYLKWANIPAVRKRYCKVFTKVMKEVCDEMGTVEYASALSRFSAEQPNFQKLLTEVLLCEEDTYRYFIEVADSCSLLLERFFSKESEKFYNGCLQIAKAYGNTRDLASVNIAFGSLLTNVRGEFQEGESRYREAMDELKSSGECKELALANQRMGWSLYRQGRHSESLSFLESARKMIKSLGLETGSLTVVNLTSLGVVNNAIGNFERAKNFHFKTLQLRRKKLGECHPSMGATYNNIGLIYNEIGNQEQALAYFKKGLEVKIKSQAILKSVVYSMNNVANQLCSLNRFEDAEAMLHDALQKLQDEANPSRDALALTYDTLGKVYLAQKEFAKADEVLEKAVEIRQDIMSNSIAFAESLMHLAQARFGANHLGSARLFIERVLEMQAKCTKDMPQNTIILESLELLAGIYHAQQNTDKRIEVLEKQQSELTRLMILFETKKCISKLDVIQKKLDDCLHLLNMLKCNNLDSKNGQMASNDRDRNTESNMPDAEKASEISKVHEVTETAHDLGDTNDLDKVNYREKNPDKAYDWTNTNETVQSNEKNSTSKSEAKAPDFFDNFCKHWNYSQKQDSSHKLKDTKFVGTKVSMYENTYENTSFCSECGRHSFTDNTCIETEQCSSNEAVENITIVTHDENDEKGIAISENKPVENSISITQNKAVDDSLVSVIAENENGYDKRDLNMPDLVGLLDDEDGQSGNEHELSKNEGNCMKYLDKDSKETTLVCLCAQCLV